jgi:exodeoxyribonuclease V beta subunit
MIVALFHSDDGVLRASSGLGERGLTNFYHLMELVSQAAQQRDLSMFYLLKWYREQLFVSTRNEGADELRLESDKKAVAIVTIHKSKGLEYPLVFLPYLWAGSGKPRDPVLFHDKDKGYQLRLDLRDPGLLGLNPDHDPARSREFMSFEETAEEKRLLYVALTRASAMCRIFWAGISSVDNSALGSLLHPGGCKTDGQMLADLEKLCRKGERRVAVSLLPLTGDAPHGAYSPKDPPGLDLSARSLMRRVQPAWRISSFSALSTSRGYAGKYEPEKFDSGARYLPGSDPGSTREIRLKAFPKGAGSGDFFHAVFEDLDFTDTGSVEGVVTENLVKFGFMDKDLWEPAVAATKEILATRLCTGAGFDTGSGSRFSLGDIAMTQRFCELEFSFDVNTLDLNAMGGLFSGEANGTYAKKLFKLGGSPFKGFIKGFIDLVILHQGKWYILDYKSNFLGTTHGDYGRKAMTGAMESHHYILQYHLYLVALHRYLGMRLKGYSYDRDFGGVFYLFIRGMHPDQGDHGVFFHRPSEAFFKRFLATL